MQLRRIELRDWLNDQMRSKEYESSGFLRKYLDDAEKSVKLVRRHNNNAYDLISRDPIVGPKWLRLNNEEQELIFNVIAAGLHAGKIQVWIDTNTREEELREVF